MKASELLNYKNWVVVGDVLKEEKYAFKILQALRKAEFNVEGVNPRDNTDKVHKSLEQVNYDIDVIDLCINPITGIKILEEAYKLGIDKILIQPGAGSEEILNFCKKNNITAIEGCALVELSNYNTRR